MSENLAEEYADALVRSLTELWDAMDSNNPDSEYRGYGTPDEALMAMPLEVTRVVGEPFRILLALGGPALGGPNAWITSNAHGEWAKLKVSWGSDVARRYGPVIDRTAHYFAELWA